LHKLHFHTLLICLSAVGLHGAELVGVVVDPSGLPVTGAQVAVFTPLGVISRQTTNDKGAFDIYVSPLYESVQLRVTAPGYATATAGMGASQIQLTPAPRSDTPRAPGSAVDAPASMQGASVATISSLDLRGRNEAQAFELLRETPGVLLEQSGPRGAATAMLVRGGDPNGNVVLLNGIPVNSFFHGGFFDFAHLPADFIEEMDIARGPQSAVYGSYAPSGVVSFETRAPENGAAFDALAEGGTHDENRFSLGGSGMPARDFGVAGSLSSLEENGAVPNADYRNDNAFLSVSYRWRTQNFFVFGDFDSNEAGDPGPFGSDPKRLYSGIDLNSRDKNNTSTYGLHWQDAVTDDLRADIFAGFYRNNSLYLTPSGGSFNNDLRAYGEGRLTYVLNKAWTMAGGYSFSREEMRNGMVTDSAGRNFLLRRDDSGIYWENRVNISKFYLNAGLREEIYQTPFIPPDIGQARPSFPSHTDTRLDLRIAGAYPIDKNTRLHASYGTGIRPPAGADLAFTNNPALKPERTEGYDVGVEERFFGNRISLDATWFRNRYKDMIVGLSGSLNSLSRYATDNLGNAKAEGVETGAQFRPAARWFSVTGNYTWLETAALSLTGGSGLIQQYFYLGQPLLRRPKQSGSVVATFQYKRLDTNFIGYFRGHSLDAEPNDGASRGLYRNGGYQNLGINLNVRVKGNLTVYADLRNALDQRYEEVYGYPNPLLSVVAGVKWNLARAR
jgi:outer membrane cobalamin receptor